MTISMHASLSAIRRGLHADYSPTLAKPLPREIEDLVAQLVAFEIGKRGSTERPVEVLQAATLPLPDEEWGSGQGHTPGI